MPLIPPPGWTVRSAPRTERRSALAAPCLHRSCDLPLPSLAGFSPALRPLLHAGNGFRPSLGHVLLPVTRGCR